jgi:predicted permease
MVLPNILLAQAQPAGNQTEIVWPWFIIGCVLLLVAIVAFFWAFAIRNLTEGQHFLLMWILPLSSGFGVGCFAGSLKATGPVGAFTVTATGGFAVWLLSYYLLPKPSGKAPDSISIKILPGMSFRQASEVLAKQDGYSAAFTGFDDSILNAKIKPEQMTAAGVLQLIEKLKYNFVDESLRIEYRVVRDSNRGLYQIEKL